MNYLRHLLKTKQSSYVNVCICKVLLKYANIKYLQYLILEETFLLLDYTVFALKNTDEWHFTKENHVFRFEKENFQEL